VSGRLVAHLGIALCWSSMAIGCSGSGPGNTGSQATSRPTAGARTGSTGATAGSSPTNGTGGNTSGGGETGGSSTGNPYRCPDSCKLAGQFCDDAGQCVECLSDSQCKSPEQPHCFLGTTSPYYGDCVECLASNQCDAGEICNPQMNCVPGCAESDTCTGSTPLCEGDSGACVTCLSAAQCSGGLVCEQGQCMECTDDFECYLNYTATYLWVCSPENNCVQCRIDADCPDGQHCVGTKCH
jgi:hypothetical protein